MSPCVLPCRSFASTARSSLIQPSSAKHLAWSDPSRFGSGLCSSTVRHGGAAELLRAPTPSGNVGAAIHQLELLINYSGTRGFCLVLSYSIAARNEGREGQNLQVPRQKYVSCGGGHRSCCNRHYQCVKGLL